MSTDPLLIPRFSIIVPVKDHLELTRALVESVQNANPGVPVEWVIVDTGSRDGTREYCARIGATVVTCAREPFNYCAAINAGAQVASGELWIISNNDIEFRSSGDLAGLARLFETWPLLSVVSPGGESSDSGPEFRLNALYGACWAVRGDAFRSWGGLPEELTGYGYDEWFTITRCWHRGSALAMHPGWEVFHHGSKTFGELGANTTPALRRNLSRLLRVMRAPDLDVGRDRDRILRRLCDRELREVAPRLAVPRAAEEWLRRQGYGAARSVPAGQGLPAGAAWVCGAPESRDRRQWLPWLANELLLQPGAEIVGAHGWYAVRADPGASAPTADGLDRLIWSARALGPPPPVLRSTASVRTPRLMEQLASLRHDWRHRRKRLPADW